MFGYYALKDKVAMQSDAIERQNDAIEKLELSIECLNQNIHDLKDDIDDLDLPDFSPVREDISDNMKRLNNMINEFKGLVSIVRGEAAVKPKPEVKTLRSIKKKVKE